MAAQQLNFADRVAVRKNIVDRCTAVVANYALYILGNGGATSQQLAWARGAIRSPGASGDAVSWYVLNQQEFLDMGSSIADGTLTSVVENAINNHFIAAA
jgi:hypothetical protein